MAGAFFVSAVDQPHPARTQAILKAHPEIRGLKLHRCDGHLLAINSTELRERTRRGLSLDYFVPHKAIVYIREKHLYRDHA